MKEFDIDFMRRVVDLYYSTVDANHPEGVMAEVARQLGITRAKVHKILITMDVIDSPLHRDIVELKDKGYDMDDIARVLGVSRPTVVINLPYEKVIYGSDAKSREALRVQDFRRRERIFMKSEVRRPTDLEIQLLRFQKTHPEFLADDEKRTGETTGSSEVEENISMLLPLFSEEESKLFAVRPDVMRLHIELNEQFTDNQIRTLNNSGGVRYGNSISRDVLVHEDMPLHNLHYVIQVLFGFLNYHLHDFQLPEDALEKITDSKGANWLKLMGVLFKDPLRDSDMDFWDDDYSGGSVRKYMRSKYTGPYVYCTPHESYQLCRKSARRIKVDDKTINEIRTRFDLNPFDLLERIPIGEILSVSDPDYCCFDEYMRNESECIKDARGKRFDELGSQPFVFPVTQKLLYHYDYGDGWEFTITASYDVSDLLSSGRVTEHKIREAVKDVCMLNRPVLLSSDGYPLVEDVGGPFGYTEFLNAVNGHPSSFFDYNNIQSTLDWGQSLGWNAALPGKSIL